MAVGSRFNYHLRGGRANLFLDGLDKQWFYLTPIAIKAKGAPALISLVEAQKAVVAKNVDVVAGQLEKIADVIADISALLNANTRKMRSLQNCKGNQPGK